MFQEVNWLEEIREQTREAQVRHEWEPGNLAVGMVVISLVLLKEPWVLKLQKKDGSLLGWDPYSMSYTLLHRGYTSTMVLFIISFAESSDQPLRMGNVSSPLKGVSSTIHPATLERSL